jgi:hypothetical protein
MEKIKNFIAYCNNIIQSGGRSSALKPLLCLSVFAIIGMWLTPESIAIKDFPFKGVFVFAFALIVCVALISYIILIFKAPRLLQSEHYQLAMRRMDLAAQQLGKDPDFQIGNDTSQAILLNREVETESKSVPEHRDAGEGVIPSEVPYVGECK